MTRGPHIKPPSNFAKLPSHERLQSLTDCSRKSIAGSRVSLAGETPERSQTRKAEQELKQAVEFRAEVMRQINYQNLVFDA